MAEEFGYEKLDVWQIGMDLTDRVYAATAGFPQNEIFALSSQMRRSAVSVPSNIAEGYGRGSKAGFAALAKISRGSLYELRTQVEIAKRQGYLSDDLGESIRTQTVLLSRKLDNFIKTLERPSVA